MASSESIQLARAACSRWPRSGQILAGLPYSRRHAPQRRRPV